MTEAADDHDDDRVEVVVLDPSSEQYPEMIPENVVMGNNGYNNENICKNYNKKASNLKCRSLDRENNGRNHNNNNNPNNSNNCGKPPKSIRLNRNINDNVDKIDNTNNDKNDKNDKNKENSGIDEHYDSDNTTTNDFSSYISTNSSYKDSHYVCSLDNYNINIVTNINNNNNCNNNDNCNNDGECDPFKPKPNNKNNNSNNNSNNNDSKISKTVMFNKENNSPKNKNNRNKNNNFEMQSKSAASTPRISINESSKDGSHGLFGFTNNNNSEKHKKNKSFRRRLGNQTSLRSFSFAKKFGKNKKEKKDKKEKNKKLKTTGIQTLDPHPKHTKCELFIYQFVQINAIIQLILDIILEFLHVVPRRINHLALTLINAFLAFKTLSAIKQEKFRFLHEDIQVLALLEICLIFGDMFIFIDKGCFVLSLTTFVYARLAFIIFSLYNLCVAIYIMRKYHLYHLYYVGDSRKPKHNKDSGLYENNIITVQTSDIILQTVNSNDTENDNDNDNKDNDNVILNKNNNNNNNKEHTNSSRKSSTIGTSMGASMATNTNTNTNSNANTDTTSDKHSNYNYTNTSHENDDI